MPQPTPHYTTRHLTPADFDTLLQLELTIFAAQEGAGATLGWDLMRHSCDQFGATSFLLLADETPVGYLLCFVCEREAHCTVVAIHPDHEAACGTQRLLLALLRVIAGQVDACWITVLDKRRKGRPMRGLLGARAREIRFDMLRTGEARVVSCFDQDALEKLRRRYEMTSASH